MTSYQKKDPAKRQIGIRWKMYAILILFMGIVVGVLWFFQVRMLHYFYQSSKFKEMELSATSVAADLGNVKNLNDTAELYASEYYMDIWVYRVIDRQAFPVVSVQRSMESDIPFLEQKFSALYDRAAENGGHYIAMVPLEDFYESLDFKVLKDNRGNAKSYPIITGYSERLSAVYVEIRYHESTEYMIVQSTEISPLRAMVTSFQSQSLWSGLILSIVALIMATLMSHVITKPIIEMNASAKQLARGNYEVCFQGGGYREISELADSLNYASTELAKTDRLLKELISNISHDLRTPLTMIKGYSEVMRDIPRENTPENIQVVIDEASRLSELVNDMLDLSRIQSGTRIPEFQVFSLTETVRSTMIRYERLMMQEGYRIEFFADCEAEIMADRVMILQVVYNLINNAINYTGEDKYVSVKQEIFGDTVRISVADTGEGIPENQIAMIWDRYYRVQELHRRATVGTGLGLSIVKGILELHNAKYGVQSTVGKGSVFWFELKIYTDSEI